MSNLELTGAYFDAWIRRDADAVLATLGETGTYEDPNTGRPISGEALRAYVTATWSVFPDLTFEIVSEAETGPDSVAAQWIMRGTNTGPMNGLPPTGKTVEVAGADFITIGDGHIRTVTGYFDTRAVPAQLGLDIIVQPPQLGPFSFGTSVSVSTGKRIEPGAYSITCLDARDDAAVEKVREGSRASMIDMLAMDDFIGATTAKIGNRMVTISAWTNPDSPRRVMREGAHAQAMKQFYDGSVASAGYTSVWTLERNNGFMVRCDACGKMTRNPEDGAACACGEPLPAHPPYW
ncbi:MAG: ester cyclase [Rhodobiaceae bacterium]|nr:ester cyclase [Rhodobiaceae bacterium]